jgi:FkbM family methyltransferase
MICGDDDFEERGCYIKGATDKMWSWNKIDGGHDGGAWEGPITDWNDSHYEKYVAPVAHKGTVVTAGGNMGLYTRAYSEIFENVYVFEPDWTNFHALVRNNYAENVYFFRAGLGAEPGWGKVNIAPGVNMGMHTVSSSRHGDLPIMTIDQLNLTRCDLIQLDIEGGEISALRGAKSTIHRFGPDVVAEGDDPRVKNLLDSMEYDAEDKSISDTVYRKRKWL